MEHPCPNCGYEMEEINCKLVCDNCTYREDCSDLFEEYEERFGDEVI